MMFSLAVSLCISITFALPITENKTCSGLECQPVISMPLVDDMKATLKAVLDVTEMNKVLKAYIQQEVQRGVKQAMTDEMSKTAKSVEKSLSDKIENTINKKTNEIRSSLEERFHSIQSGTQETKPDNAVIMTACTRYKGGMLATEKLAFTDVRTVFGVDNVSLVKTEGTFTCEKPGLYLISVYVMSEIKNARLITFKNNNVLSYGHFAKTTGGYQTCTIVLFEQLSVNDVISAKLYISKGKYVSSFGDKQSCLSVLKVK